MHASRANLTNRVRPLPLFAAARIAHLDPTPCPVPPDWSKQGYGSIFVAQGAEVD